jgi:hypothetical protein
MKQTAVLERDAARGRDTADKDYALNLTVVYHDARTLAWAREVFERVTKVTGKEWVRPTWWKISDLVEPGVLAGAVSVAMRAEVVIVAIDAAEGLPLPFHVWVHTWLPHRVQGTGYLFALVGASEPATGAPKRVREYLREVARMGGFEFLLEERQLATEAAPSSRARGKAPVRRGVPARTGALVSAPCGK